MKARSYRFKPDALLEAAWRRRRAGASWREIVEWLGDPRIDTDCLRCAAHNWKRRMNSDKAQLDWLSTATVNGYVAHRRVGRR